MYPNDVKNVLYKSIIKTIIIKNIYTQRRTVKKKI